MGAYLVQYSEGRYSFVIYGFVALIAAATSYRMSIELELDDLGDSESQLEKKRKETFCQRVKKDYKIIKHSLQAPAIYRLYLFWLLMGLTPKYEAYDYMMIKQVYKMS